MPSLSDELRRGGFIPRPPRPQVVVGIGAILLVAVALVIALRSGTPIMLAVGLGICALPLVVLAAVKIPFLYFWVFGFILGMAPFTTLPGTGTQLVFYLAIFCTILALAHGRERRVAVRTSPILIWMLVTIAACLISMFATWTGGQSFNEYWRWGLASLLTVVVMWMAPTLRIAVSRAFGVGGAAGAVLSIGIMVFDKGGTFVQKLTFIGYGAADSVTVRTADVSGQAVTRATGLYIDPNTAGLFFIMAFAVAAYVFSGRVRLVLLACIGAGLVATLSRSAILALVVAALIFVIAQRQTAGRRFIFIVIGIVAVVGLASVPGVSGRLESSFSSNDRGASDRIAAFTNYPGQMEGHWIFGKGWALREFIDPFYGYLVNHVANTPLLFIYRSGVISGLAFIALLIVGIIAAVRGLHTHRLGFGLMSAMYLGLVLIAFQLDFPVVTVPPLTMAFSLLLANIGVADTSHELVQPPPLVTPTRAATERGLPVTVKEEQKTYTLPKRFIGLDGLRGILALCVIMVHVSADFNPTILNQLHIYVLGQAIVVFFVLSGLLIYWPFMNAILDGRPLPSLGRYAKARALRVYPAYIVAFLIANFGLRAVFVANAMQAQDAGPAGSGTGMITDPWRLLAHLTLVQNLLPTELQTGINASWTLTAELTFYLVLPFLCMGAAALAVRFGVRPILAAAAPGVVLIVVGLIARVVSLIWFTENQAAVPSLLDASWGANLQAVFTRSFLSWADNFGWGMLVALAVSLFHRRRGSLMFGRLSLRGLAWILLGVGLVVTAASYLLLSRAPAIELFIGAFFGVFSAGLVLLLTTPLANGATWRVSTWVDNRVLYWLGTISLSLYIWHYPVLLIILRLGWVAPDTWGGFAWNYLIVLAFSVIVASISYKFVEAPAISLLRRRKSSAASSKA